MIGAETLAAESRDPGEWECLVRGAERAGDLLLAYDYASRGLEEHPDDPMLRYRAVLNLSRSGANNRAEALYDQYGLAASHVERVAVLGARLLRERALAQSGPASVTLLV